MCGLLPDDTHLCDLILKKKKMVSVHFFFIFVFSLVSINYMEYLTIPAYPSLTCSFNRGNIEGTNSSKICVCMCLQYVSFHVCIGTGFVDWLEKGFVCEKSFEMWICLWRSWIVPRLPHAIDRMLKFNYWLTHDPLGHWPMTHWGLAHY